MKTLYLIRHAKASWDDPTGTDFERPLTEVGRNHAHVMGKKLKGQGVKPDLIISSSAVRALNTAEIIAEALQYPLDKIDINEKIYNAGVEELLDIIKKIPSANKTVFFFGHNPGLTWLLHYICEGAKMNIPTCGIVAISFQIKTWDQLLEADGQLVTFMHPPHEQEQAI